MSSSLLAILLFWMSSSAATRPMPVSVTWYSPVSARAQRSDSMADNSDINSDEISVIETNPDVMEKSTAILYGGQPHLSPLRLDKMDAQWLQNTLEPDMEETQADTDMDSATDQHSPLTHENRDMATLLNLEKVRSKKRGDGHSLSVVNPVDVLRQRMLMEAARERMRQNQDQIEANAQFLNQIGKRQALHQQPLWLRAWDSNKVALETTRTQAS